MTPRIVFQTSQNMTTLHTHMLGKLGHVFRDWGLQDALVSKYAWGVRHLFAKGEHQNRYINDVINESVHA